MTALTKDRVQGTPFRSGEDFEYPVAAATTIYAGAIVALDSSGNAEPGSAATGKIAVGICQEQADNSGGGVAAINVKVKSGTARLNNSSGDAVTKANIGDTVYMEDDNTVCATGSGKSAAGVMMDIDSYGVWVELSPKTEVSVGLLSANNLSDVSDAATSRTSLGLGTIATQDADSVVITGGSVAGITDLAVADGGTGASDAATARTNLGLDTMAVQAASAVNITGGGIAGITDLAVADGGTGASDAATARSNLGLGTIATQDADSVAITGGNVSGITDLAVADGGTGASDAATARTNLGLDTMAVQAASAVAITGGSVTGITDLAVADGGTGASDAATARTNLGLDTMAVQAASAVNITGGDIAGITDLAVADGGTGASDAATARTNLGLDTMAVQDASNVAITGGSVTGITDLAVADGGTGASNASDARDNLGLGSSDTPAFAGASLGASTALVKSAKVTITAAELKALAATPQTLVAAVASKYFEFLGATLKLNYGSEVLVEPSAPDDLEVKLKDGSGTTVSTTADAGLIIVPAADAYATMKPIEVEGGALADRVNVPLVLHNTGGEYTGNASNDTTLEVTVSYIEHDVS